MDDQRDGEGGASLLGVVLVLVILGALGGLAVLAVNRLVADPSLTSARLNGLVPPDAVADGGAAARPRSPAFGPSITACTATVRSVEQAVAAKHATDGTYPATVAELVAGRWLSGPPVLGGHELTMEVAGGRPTGKVLVNGLPPEQGCAAPQPSRP